MKEHSVTHPILATSFLQHSAKGSSWKKHKYIKRVDGTYFYPKNYEGGRHLETSKFSEYSDGDPDFDDKNYSKQNRLGDTDFFGFERPDGTYVILEEDMKWELPKGTKITPELIKRLESFDKTIEQKRNNGEKYSSSDWQKMATEAIDGTSSGGGDYDSDDVEALAKEVIKGNFGNGKTRKELLGDAYSEVQKKVNEMLSGSNESKKLSNESKTVEAKKIDPETKKKIDAMLSK